MPATAGRVRMPANNRMQTSASLNTHSIWQNAIGCAPAAQKQPSTPSASEQTGFNASAARTQVRPLRRRELRSRGGGELRRGFQDGPVGEDCEAWFAKNARTVTRLRALSDADRETEKTKDGDGETRPSARSGGKSEPVAS